MAIDGIYLYSLVQDLKKSILNSKIDKINAFVYNRWNNDIIMFLHNNPHHNTAAEIVRIRKSTKSHVSSSLKKLENKGLIKRKQSKDNKKHII